MDQLNDYLLTKYPERYYSAKDGHSLLLLGRKTDAQPAMGLYTIAVPQTNINIPFVKTLLADNAFYILSYRLTKKINIPFITIAFPSDSDDDGAAEFIISTDGYRYPRFVNSSELEGVLLDFLHLEKSSTAPKTVNKHTADFFHNWSRNHLPSGDEGVIKCDLDGLFCDANQNGILIEIKRSSIPKIPKWRPYSGDFTGLNFLRNIALTLSFKFWIMHHEGQEITEDTEISIFDIELHNPIEVPKGPSYINIYNPIQIKVLSSLL